MVLSNEPSPTLSPVEAKQLLAFAEQGRLYEIEIPGLANVVPIRYVIDLLKKHNLKWEEAK